MTSAFPGMDPYLEHPALWPDVHNGLVAELRNVLAPLLRPGYYVSLEERAYLAEPDELLFVGRTDMSVARPRGTEASPGPTKPAAADGAIAVRVPTPDPVRECYLEVRATGTDEVITVLELLSPANKRAGRGRQLYERKRMKILGTRTHLVEVDLIRAGRSMRVFGPDTESDYRVLVSRGDRRPNASLWQFSVREPIPVFRLPLRVVSEEPTVDVGGVLQGLYDKAGYDLRIDYRSPPVPPLRDSDVAWCDELLRSVGLR